MALTRLGITKPAANTDTSVFTSVNPYLMSIIATNLSTSTAALIRVWVVPYGETDPTKYAYINYDIPVDQANTFETFRFAVNPGDTIYVRSSTADVSFAGYGLVQYDIKLGAGISSYQATAPANPVQGMIWVDSDGVVSSTGSKPIYIYDGTSWVQSAALAYVPLGNTAPVSPVSGDLWVDNTYATEPVLKVYNGTSWILVGADTGINPFFLTII